MKFFPSFSSTNTTGTAIGLLDNATGQTVNAAGQTVPAANTTTVGLLGNAPGQTVNAAGQTVPAANTTTVGLLGNATGQTGIATNAGLENHASSLMKRNSELEKYTYNGGAKKNKKNKTKKQ
jgi:hypothetical protein